VKIAVVIPALDEAGRIGEAIQSALAPGLPNSDAPREDVEILVVDGGSRDQTVERARAAGARVLVSERGRARQLEAGWRASAADVVVFLHADTRLEAGWGPALRRAMGEPDVVGGAFRFRFDHEGGGLRLIEWGARLRVRLFAMPYGDQAIFVRRAVLERIGGVPQVALMEDVDLVAAMNRVGRVVSLPQSAITSSRRYEEGGVLRTMVLHWLALAAWRLGVDRARIAGWLSR
jgi:rSAM/selenodomain-associated transferase 2